MLIVLGTRPEAIKLGPVIRELRARSHAIESRLCFTAQHRVLVDDVLSAFRIVPDRDLGVMTVGQTLSRLAARVLERMEDVLEEERPDVVLVQGDTTTVMATAVACFHAGLPLAHVEAGLRTYDLRHPFPEEANRRIASIVTAVHFAPTERAREALLAEGVADDAIDVTGNPGLDALRLAVEGHLGTPPEAMDLGAGGRLILVTAHRRESFGVELRQICEAIARIAAERRDSVRIVLPVHPNPRVEGPVRGLLGGIPNVILLRPVPYVELVSLLRQSYLVLTDSGGLQEEGPALGKPVLVMREATERPEAVEEGAAILVGRDRDAIVEQTLRLLDDGHAYAAMAVPRPIYGDGYAAGRIADGLVRRFARS